MINKVNMMSLSSSKRANEELVHVGPGTYFKVSENSRAMIKEATTGLLVSSYTSAQTGKLVYNIVLVGGELILVPKDERHV